MAKYWDSFLSNCRSAAQDNTQTDMRYLGSCQACAAYHHMWPRTLHNKMIQLVNLPWPGNDLGTILGCGCLMLRSKGLKDATCVGWFGDDWDCSVGSPPEAMDHVSSAVPVGYAVL